MTLKTLSATAALLAATSTAALALSIDEVIERLNDQGFTEVEIERSSGRVTIEAKGNGLEREIVYDANGSIRSDTIERDDDDDDDDRDYDDRDDDDRDDDDRDDDDRDDRDDDEDDDRDERDDRDDRDDDDDDDDDDDEEDYDDD